jgi:ABC-type branched-subunit amino acid transport system ATPase component
MSNILTIQSLTKGFTRKIRNLSGDDENEQYWIIKDLSLNVPKGKIIAIIGGNGAGKTTMFNIISGFVRADKGDIRYEQDGKQRSLGNMAPHHIAGLGIGRMFQDNHIFPEMSVIDNLLVADSVNSAEKPFINLIQNRKIKKEEGIRKQKAESVIRELFREDASFWEKKDQPAGTLSYGQQRLLGLARLFMRDYRLLLLDEPTAGVNPEVIEQIKRIIKRFAESGQTVLLIEHNLDVVKDLADFCCYMANGRIALMGTPDDVINNDEVRRSYIGL